MANKRDEMTPLAIGAVAGGPAAQLFTSLANDGARANNYTSPFVVSPTQLGNVSEARTRTSLAELLSHYIEGQTSAEKKRR